MDENARAIGDVEDAVPGLMHMNMDGHTFARGESPGVLTSTTR
jgi:hypothetical protein